MVFVDSAAIMRLMIRKNIGTYELARRAGVRAKTVKDTLEGKTPTKIMTPVQNRQRARCQPQRTDYGVHHMKNSVLHDAVVEYLHVQREIICSELRETELTTELRNLHEELDGLANRLEQLRQRRDELATVVANAALEFLRKE